MRRARGARRRPLRSSRPLTTTSLWAGARMAGACLCALPLCLQRCCSIRVADVHALGLGVWRARWGGMRGRSKAG